jgi:alpha-glucan,water dikinase
VLLPFTCRNHIPEKKGTWMEEWHQKLHNNTTPDDVPICSAYIAFLEVRSGPFS